ncbi:AAA family ATPase [Pseudomonas sp. zfem004]|uniref:AAA family ATPase n=1 Tax=Pseudomonas sp. zfem004 TaxID=3078199 RepID=UPI002928DFB5|nr:AAA family ATPase [Pseudomonas sp. zfem004]MDU9402700.1 AAA family ATPase [Pseudomonas sp. zfem004]
MKIKSLSIENFRGISKVDIDNLGDTIIIAGQNGSGKSCIFDAIRLLKSCYGGYQQNEWQHFFGEFAIQLHGGSGNLNGLFNDASKPLKIKCEFILRDNEKVFISNNAATLLEQTIWQTLLPEAFQYGGHHKALFSTQFRERQPEVNSRVSQELPPLMEALSKNSTFGTVTVDPQGNIFVEDSRLLTVVFTNYKPRDIGVIDFHGAQRHYGRETVQGINLNLEQTNQQYSQHTLYNYNNKYSNVKGEMAGNYIKELLAEKASPSGNEKPSSLTSTLQELFESFFPDKKFLGPQPTPEGSLSFPVVTPNGTVHDLDELSSGEKEILYGYLRIRSSAPRDSIILLDEPELHLNPRLIRGLPEFYRKHLGEALKNQLWLVTHSDALIREAVGKPGFNVFHMSPCGSEHSGTSQLKALTVGKDLEMATADLVGDLAAYRPGGKGLIFEGGGDSDFDKSIAASLFPEELRGINLISGTNKNRVKALHEILARAYEHGHQPTKYYAIVDRDSEVSIDSSAGVNRFEWDVYHIENYLLHPEIIAEVINNLNLGGRRCSNDSVRDKLNQAARRVVPQMIIRKMRSHANSKIVQSIDLGFSPETQNVAEDLHKAITRSMDRIKKQASTSLLESELKTLEDCTRAEIDESFINGTWLQTIPGRDILKQYVNIENISISYEIFRNLIVAKMVEKNHKPEGMSRIINRIVND